MDPPIPIVLPLISRYECDTDLLHRSDEKMPQKIIPFPQVEIK